MGFMERQIEQGEWYEVDSMEGTSWIPVDVVGYPSRWEPGTILTEESPDWNAMLEMLSDYLGVNEDRVHSITFSVGWGARLSAPGYMDCTEWCVFDTKQEAIAYLDEYYPEDEEDED